MMASRFLLLILFLPFSTLLCHSESTTLVSASSSSISPLTPKASLLRYWARKIINNHPRPDFFISKLSPLSPPAFAAFSSLSPSQLSSNLPAFCSSAHLACPLAASSSSSSLRAHKGPSAFSAYNNSDFTNYATKSTSAATSFSNYSASELDAVTTDTFRRYSRGATHFSDSFSAYSPDTTNPTSNFTSYSSSSSAGTADFSAYHRNVNNVDLTFTSYDDTAAGPTTRGFHTYADSTNSGDENFAGYGKNGRGGIREGFAAYSTGSNAVDSGFKAYAQAATGSRDNFTSYAESTNGPNLKFSSYDADGKDAVKDFSTYGKGGNGGDQSFESYGKKADAVGTFASYNDELNSGSSEFSGYGRDGERGSHRDFASYGHNGNVVTLGFSSYGENGKKAADNFTSYGFSGGTPEQGFKAYGSGADGGVESFTAYRNQSIVGDDSFSSYGKKGTNGHRSEFDNYGQSFHDAPDNFTAYGQGSFSDVFNFTSYFTQQSQFQVYANKGKGNEFSFTAYANSSTVPPRSSSDKKMVRKRSGSFVNRWVEPGKFFRERELKKGTVMPMPDIRDKMPARSFLPRSIAANIPFSAGEIREVFKLPADNVMGKAVGDTITECERAPSRGETKKCAASAEDMIDFAVSVLGSDVAVRSTENTRGSKGSIMIGDVKGVNGGKITQSVSCHQSLFPFLVYYCHSVPKVRVYEADILSVDGKEKINHGVAICHIDTSDWSAGHGAFLALGSVPGKIEVCHWIFEGDMTWAKAD